MGSELRVPERLTYDTKITSTRIAWLEDSAKISRLESYAFYSIFTQSQNCKLVLIKLVQVIETQSH